VGKVDVVVIGAGATGAGVARDLALRGMSVALVDRGDFAHGTSGRNHGLLHSGGRYAVEDLETAAECIRENAVVRRIAAHCVDPCGGMFAGIEGDDPGYGPVFAEACAKAGIETRRIGPREALEREPNLTSKVREAYLVPDAGVDPFLLCLANAVDAAEHGAEILTHHDLCEVRRGASGVRGLVLEDVLTGEQREIECRVVVNAAGPWAGEVAAKAGLVVGLVLSRGSLVVTRGRLVRGVVNRLRKPTDGDAIVPGGPVCLAGTTSVRVSSPDDLVPSADEARKLVAWASELIPAFSSARIMREFAGVRPLYTEGGSGSGREVSRGFAVLDHARRDGLEGFVTVVGGKLSTYRLMAEKTADVVASKLGVTAACTTAERVLPGSESHALSAPEGVPRWMAKALETRHGSRAGAITTPEDDAAGRSRVCVCECVTEAEIRFAMRRLFARTLGDLRRRTRLGMGPCQGSTCGPRAAALLAEETGLDLQRADRMLREFLEERDDGMLPVLRQGGAAQEEMNLAVARGFAVGREVDA
jgi:glycerol-3-phosphate dehydrogenase